LFWAFACQLAPHCHQSEYKLACNKFFLARPCIREQDLDMCFRDGPVMCILGCKVSSIRRSKGALLATLQSSSISGEEKPSSLGASPYPSFESCSTWTNMGLCFCCPSELLLPVKLKHDLKTKKYISRKNQPCKKFKGNCFNRFEFTGMIKNFCFEIYRSIVDV
jgi:hypothetical protein